MVFACRVIVVRVLKDVQFVVALLDCVEEDWRSSSEAMDWVGDGCL